MRQVLQNVLDEADASAEQIGPTIPAYNLLYCSLQAVATDTAAGDIKIQFSNDIVDPTLAITEPTNWSDIPNATIAVAAGVVAIPKIDLCYQFIRVVFTPDATDPGTISANLKALGA